MTTADRHPLRSDTAGPGPEAEEDWPRWPEEFAARYRAAGWWRGETFGGMLRDRAAAHPERPAVIDPGGARRRVWTYAELDQRADTLAAGLQARGIGRGDRVVVQLPNIAEFFEVVFALFRIGAVPVFALPVHRRQEIQHFCAFTEAVAYVIPDRHAGFDHRALARTVSRHVPSLRHVFVAGTAPAGGAAELPDAERHEEPLSALRTHPPLNPVPDPPGPEGLAFLQLSGGTTGVPKLIPRTHDDYLYSLRGSNDICRVTRDTVYLCALPAAHNFPMSSPGHLGTLHAGGRVVLAPQTSPEVAFPLIENEGVTLTGLVPPLAHLWLEAARDGAEPLRTLDAVLVGGAKFSETAARRIRPVLGCALQQVFGMAEGLVNYTRRDDPEETVATTQGRPISPDDEVRVVDDEDRDVPDGSSGHLLTRGPYTIRGYWRAPEHNTRAFTPDGFYRTGDIVRRTPEGNLIVEGRAKDQINRGGEKVAVDEVENVLLRHPAVHDAALVAVPDPYLGERTCAHVLLRAGEHPAPAAAELKRFVRESGLAAHKVPDQIRFADSFPYTGIGKTSKKDLRAAIAADMAAQRTTEEP